MGRTNSRTLRADYITLTAPERAAWRSLRLIEDPSLFVELALAEIAILVRETFPAGVTLTFDDESATTILIGDVRDETGAILWTATPEAFYDDQLPIPMPTWPAAVEVQELAVAAHTTHPRTFRRFTPGGHPSASPELVIADLLDA